MRNDPKDIDLSTALFKTLIENSHEVISICDKNFNVLYRSPSADSITGYNSIERNEVGGVAQTHPEDIAKLKLAMNKVLENPNKPIPVLFRTKHKLGHFIWMEGLITNKLADENIKGIIINLKDVSDRIQYEQNLQLHLKEISDYKYALDESSIVAITDQKGIITYANDNFCKISKYSREELIGKDHRIVNSGYHNKDFIKEIWTTIAKGKIWRGDIKNKAKDGTTYWVETTIIPFLNEAEKPYQYVAIRYDITERKKMEEQQQLFASIVNSSDDAILSKNLNGIITSWNKGAERIFGYLDYEMIGKSILKIIPSYLQHEEKEIINSICLGQVVNHYETKRIRNDGKIIDVSITVSPIKDLQGKIIGASKIIRDITNQKNAEAQILQLNADLDKKVLERTNELLLAQNKLTETLESTRFLASIAENIQDPVISSDNNYIITKWNNAAEKLLGWKSEEVIGKTTIEVLKPNFPYQTREQIIAILNKNDFWQGEVIYHTKSNKPIQVLATVSHLKDINENITGNLALIKDISERIKLEKKLQEFEHFFNNSNDLSCIANKEGYFEIINTSFEKILGYTSTDFSENPFINFVHPDDITATLEEYEKLKSDETVIHFYNRYRKKDGNYLWLDWNATPNPITGKLYCIARDITAKKMAEEALTKLNEELEQKVIERTETIAKRELQYRYLFMNNPMPMWVMDLDTFKFLDVNQMTLMQYGYSREEFLSMTAIDIRPDEEKNSFVNFDRSLNIDSQNYNKGIWKHKKKDETIIHVEIIAHEILFEGKKARIILANNVTKRLESEKLLSENLKELARSNRELEQFAYIASHDLQEPLRMVGSYVQLLERRYKGKLDSDADEFIYFAVDGAARMKKLIGDLLSYSRINKEVSIKPINLTVLMNEVIQNLSPSINEKGAIINFTELPIINADKTQMVQLFQNLISNAIKFTKEGIIPEINIKVEKQNNYWLFSINDNGIGIEEQYSEKVFIIFKQLHTKAKYGGTGIGLAIAKKIVERQGGNIWFESEIGKGTTFYFTLNSKT